MAGETTLVYEYPTAEGDPYYPVPRPENVALYQKYHALAEATSGVHFAGRLGTYKFYNMDQVTAQSLTLYGKLSGKQHADLLETQKRVFQVAPTNTIPADAQPD